MAKYRKISYSEYSVKGGDLVVIGKYGDNNYALNISFECAKRGANMAIFNLRESLKQELSERLEAETLSGELYIDDTTSPTIDQIIDKCNQIRIKSIIIDFPCQISYTKAELRELKQLCESLDIIEIIVMDISKTGTKPKASDFNNKALKDIADVICIITDTKEILLKNKYGKVGIFTNDESELVNI